LADLGGVTAGGYHNQSAPNRLGVRSDANGRAELTIATRIGKIHASATYAALQLPLIGKFGR